MINNDSTLMQMLASQMRYMAQRQGVLAQNIANVDTPGYKARDLKKLDFSKMAEVEAGRLAMRQTTGQHLNGTHAVSGDRFRSDSDRKNFEISPTGNSVVLDEQMAKVSDTTTKFQISESLLKKFNGMYRLALGNR